MRQEKAFIAYMGLCIGAACILPAAAQVYPAKTVRIIAASSPGSAVDIVSRIIGHKLSERIGQQVIVDNRAGAGGNLGAELAAKAAPDGYTLFLTSVSPVISTVMERRLNYDVIRDYSPITLIATGHYVIVVHPSLPVKSVKELIALARSQPGRLNYAMAGIGNSTHLAGELFKSLAHVDLVSVAYKGTGPALTALMGGEVHLMFANLTAALPNVKSGRLRALAVTGEKRSPAMPELPTVTESSVPGYVVVAWFGMLLPAGARPEIVTRLHGELLQTLREPFVRERLAGEGAEPTSSTPDEFGAFIKSELAKWGAVVRKAKITAE